MQTSSCLIGVALKYLRNAPASSDDEPLSTTVDDEDEDEDEEDEDELLIGPLELKLLLR